MRRTALVILTVTSVAVASRKHETVVAPPAPLATASSALALAALDRKIADLDAEDQESKKELSGLGPRIKEAHARAITRGRSLYKLTRAGMLPIGGGFDAFMRHAMDVEHARHALERDVDDERRMRSHGADVARSLERVARDRESLASQRNAMDAARTAMEDEQRRQKAFESAFDTQASDDYVIIGHSGADPAGAGFSASRGKLVFPVVGKADVRPARREGGGPGIEVLAPSGCVVRAIYAGKVAFADRYGAYGRIIILDHGEHYYSVSGNLGSIEVKIGDDVTAGERVGTVGDSDQGPMLYFEIRHGSQTVQPGPWLGL
jgi:septal ring factor EnvC (AmiA/AmiB activator)